MNTNTVLIDKESISQVINEIGTPVQLYIPSYTADMEGDVRQNYLDGPFEEIALIRTRTDTNVLNEQGLSFQGDALGYFSAGSRIDSEVEVHVTREDKKGKVVYFVISTQSSFFEGSLKFTKAILQKRRYEVLQTSE
jgi:hypothetical protein